MAANEDLTRWDGFITQSLWLNARRFFGKGWNEEKRRRYRVLADTLFAKPTHFVDPRLINMTLLGHQEIEWREGTEWNQIGKVPDAEAVEWLLDVLVDLVDEGLLLLLKANADEKQKVDFCWLVHNELRCIQPFAMANGQTARYMLNHLRRLLGLAILGFDERDAGEYHQHLTEYRESVFLPRLRKQKIAA